MSPTLELGPGSYAIVADGTVARGGLLLGGWDPVHFAWFASGGFWSGQVGFPGSRMVSKFTLDRPESFQVALANWVPRPAVSNWSIGWVELARLPQGG